MGVRTKSVNPLISLLQTHFQIIVYFQLDLNYCLLFTNLKIPF